MGEDMINVKKMTSLIKTRCNRIIQSNLNLNICDKFKFDCVVRRGAGFFVRAEPSGSEGGLSEEMKNREGVASGSATYKLNFCLDKWSICKKSLNIIKFRYAVFSFHNMMLKYTKKTILISMCALFLAGCSYTMEEAADKFEDRLESFVGKPMQEVIRRCGHPTKYMNRADLPGEESGTYMIYNFKRFNSECEVILKYKKGTLEIIDWDYSGYCLNTSRLKIDDQCFGL